MVMLVRIITTVLWAAAFTCSSVSLATDSACSSRPTPGEGIGSAIIHRRADPPGDRKRGGGDAHGPKKAGQGGRGKTGDGGQVRSCDVALRLRRKGDKRGQRYQHKELAMLTVEEQRIAVILPIKGQEVEEEGRNQAQDVAEAEEGSDRPEDEQQRIHDGPVQGRASPKGGEEPYT